jgi:hypothetical protein
MKENGGEKERRPRWKHKNIVKNLDQIMEKI